ncbi:MAG: CbiX/SirB N-terminal domain-containing protein [Pirellulales bacterium]
MNHLGPQLGVILVDHGSRRAESNNLLLDVAADFAANCPQYRIVEPAHMELAEPSVATAFRRCVERGATTVIVFPYFLLPGRHWELDIPRLAAAAARNHPGVPYLVTAPFGLHPLISRVIEQRIEQCMSRSAGAADACDVCAGTDRCQLREGSD